MFDQASKDAYFEILKDTRSIYEGTRSIYRHQATDNGERFVIGTLYKDDPDAKLGVMGRDIIGDGVPDLSGLTISCDMVNAVAVSCR